MQVFGRWPPKDAGMDGGNDLGAATLVQATFKALGDADPSPSLEERRTHLATLRSAVLAHAEELARAMDADFGGRSRTESILADVAIVLSGIDWTLRRLKRWMRPQRVWLP